EACSLVVGLFEAEYRNRLGCGLLATGIWGRTAEQTVKSEADLLWNPFSHWTSFPFLDTLTAPGAHSGDHPKKEIVHEKYLSLHFRSTRAVAVLRGKRRPCARRREKNKDPERSRPRRL